MQIPVPPELKSTEKNSDEDQGMITQLFFMFFVFFICMILI